MTLHSPPPCRLAALALLTGAALLGCNSSEDAKFSGQGGSLADASAGQSASNAGGSTGSAGRADFGSAGAVADVGGAGGARSIPTGGAAHGGNAGGTSNAGPSAVDGGSAGESEPPREPGVTGIIAVGYGGLRIVSRDLGRTWQNETHWSTDGGDDDDLLRTIVYGNALWISAGWRLVTSNDGVTWLDHGMAEAVITPIRCPVTDGMAFGAGKFLVACGSNLASSTDGLAWTKVGATPKVGGHPYLIWDETEQRFVCSGDDGPSFVSDDGASWTQISIEKAHLCQGAVKPKSECKSFYVQGVFLSTEWGGVIRRSSNGTNFEKTYQDEFENNLFTEYSFGVGRVTP